MTAPVRFRQSDLARALKAAEQAGRDVKRAEIDADGNIRLYFTETAPESELDRWRRENASAP